MSEQFAKYILEHRKNIGVSQAKLAKRANCAPSLIAGIEKANRLPSHRMAKSIAEALEIPFSEFEKELEQAQLHNELNKVNQTLKRYQFTHLGEEIEAPILEQLLKNIRLPADLIALEEEATEVLTITRDFWIDRISLEYIPGFKQLLKQNIDRGVKYTYIHPKNVINIRFLQEVQSIYEEIGSENVSFHAIDCWYEDLFFAGYERIFYHVPSKKNKELLYNYGFLINKLETTNPSNILVHEEIPDAQLERYNHSITNFLKHVRNTENT